MVNVVVAAKIRERQNERMVGSEREDLGRSLCSLRSMTAGSNLPVTDLAVNGPDGGIFGSSLMSLINSHFRGFSSFDRGFKHPYVGDFDALIVEVTADVIGRCLGLKSVNGKLTI